MRKADTYRNVRRENAKKAARQLKVHVSKTRGWRRTGDKGKPY